MNRYLLSLAASATAFAGSLAFAAPALAEPPVGGCPPNFFLYPVSKLPPTSGAESVDVNGDGYTCVQLIATDAQGTPLRFVAVDNASSVPPGIPPSQ